MSFNPDRYWWQTYMVNRTKRGKLFDEQGGRCCYCETPMWETVKGLPKRIDSARPFMQLHSIPYHQARLLLCTVEHLIGRKDGGSHDPSNLAAACQHCNSKRFGVKYDIDPFAYKQYVMKQMRRDTWFDFTMHDKFEYVNTPTSWDNMMGKVMRRVKIIRKYLKKMKRNYRMIYPKSMTKLQFIQSYIRSISP